MGAVWKPAYESRCRVGVDSYLTYIEIPCGILVMVNMALLTLGVYALWAAKKASEGITSAGGGALQKNL